MNRILNGIVTAGMCCLLLAGCESAPPDGMSLTYYGRVESIQGDMVTLQPGSWEDGRYIQDESSPTITVQAKPDLAPQCEGLENITWDDLEVGTVVRFTVSASIDDGERLTQIEIVARPD